MKRIVYLVAVVAVLLPSPAQAEDPVYFPDSNLKAAVEAKLRISDPTPTDMLNLTWLQSPTSAGIVDLTGLEYATNLEVLRIYDNQINNISPLSGLTELVDLRLSDNEIVDINALSGLTKLNHIDLARNQVSDISALAGLTNLVVLYLGDNHITHIPQLSGLSKLEELHLYGNPQLGDLSGLSGLTNLMRLDIYSSQIGNIDALSGLTNLQYLSLERNQISDISALSDLTNLTELIMYMNEISDISALSGLTNIEELHLSWNQISNIDPLSELTNLTSLDLHGNEIADISALSGLSNLTWLNLRDNLQISAITALSGLMNLIELDLSNNQIGDISAVSQLTNLTNLVLRTNLISDISALSGLTNLTNLNLDDNLISDVNAVSELMNLTDLVLCQNQISDISAVVGLTNLANLNLGDNQISDISALSGLTNLMGLWLGENQINDISALSGLTNLTDLKLGQNQISDMNAVSELVNMTNLDLGQNQISDMNAVSGLVNLTYLDMNHNQISDISAVSALTRLTSLHLPENEISNISALSGLTNLNWLNLHTNYIPDITALSELTNLIWLDVHNNQLTEVDALAGPTNLTELYMHNNQISDINALSGLLQLTDLNLNDNQISNVSALTALTGLSTLDLLVNPLNVDVCNDDIPQILENNPDIQLSVDQCTIVALTLSATGGGSAIIPGSESSQYVQGTPVTIEAIPDANHHFTTWAGTAVDAGKVADPQSATTTVTIDDDYTLQAKFAEDPVYFPDSNLKAAVEQALGVSNPTPTDMLALTGFDAGHKEIVDLTGLEYATNLTSLNFSFNQIRDINALSELVNLTSLGLSNNQIAEVNALSGLTNLTELFLYKNQISDISALLGLTQLIDLNLYDNQIDDVSALSGLENLRLLNLSHNQVSAVSPLSGLTNLEVLYLDSNRINNIDPLAGLTNLTQLYLDGNLISDTSGLSGLSNLQELTLPWNEISDIGPLTGLVNLTSLDLSNNQISNINAVSGLTNLVELYLGWNQIINIQPVSELMNLTRLHLRANQINDISALSGLTNLMDLRLYNNQINDISALSGLTNLTNLRMWGNQISDISYLSELVELRDLDLSSNSISDVNALSRLTNLTGLWLSENQISNISALSGLTNVTNLGLSNNQISDINALSGLTDLTDLQLNLNQINDVNALSELTNLTILSLYENQISDVNALSGLTNLQHLELFHNQISDISSLSAVTSLTHLYVNKNQIGDISALSELVDLKDLWLGSNQISDINALSGLTNLKELRLENNQIDNISALSGLTNLELLFLPNNQVDDVSALSGLTNLTVLYLYTNQIIDISALSGLTNLNELRLNENQISNIDILSGLTELRILYLQGNQISNISSLSGLMNLTWLSLGYNQISNVSALTELTDLSTLELQVNPLNVDVCNDDIPQILENNPGIVTLKIDQCTIVGLTISSGSGGFVNLPGDGLFHYVQGAVETIEAVPTSDYPYVIWSGTAVDEGKVADPESPTTTVTVDGNYTLEANFVEILGFTYVDDDAVEDPGPGDPAISDPNEDGSFEHPFDAIQEAIDDARDGYIVIVLDGNYVGIGNKDIDFKAKRVMVRSQNGPENCIIDCENDGRGFIFDSGETDESVVNGFTITNGLANSDGGAIYCNGSSPTIQNNIIMGNRANLAGGGIYCISSSAKIENNEITQNTAANEGGGIRCYTSSTTIQNNRITLNWATQGSGIACEGSSPVIQSNEIVQNSAASCGGIFCRTSSSPAIINNTISGNSGGLGGGILCVLSSSPTVLNTILWANDTDEIYVDATSSIDITYSDVQGGWLGRGNIDAEAFFANPASSDYHLSATSPCIDAGDPSYAGIPGETDIDGEPRVIYGRIDMGADEVGNVEPTIEISPREFEFFSDPDGPNPGNQALSIGNTGINALNWTISYDCDWLQISPNSGTSMGELNEVTIGVDTAGLAQGYYRCLFTISDCNATNSPQTASAHLYLGEISLVPDQFSTIQAAIDNISTGGTVVVFDGTYTGAGNRDIDFEGKEITVCSKNGPESCIINCQGTLAENHRGFYFNSGEDENSIMDGFTIISGFWENGGEGGAGIYCNNSSPTIHNCIISNNSPDGMYLEDSNPTIGGIVEVISCDLAGNGNLLIAGDATLSLVDSQASCNIAGIGTIEVPAGREFTIENDAIVDLSDPNDPNVTGTINCNGLLRVTDNAYLSHATMNIIRAIFEGSAVISENLINTSKLSPYGQITAKDTAAIVDNYIYSSGDRYIDLDPAAFAGIIQNNQIYVTIVKAQGSIEAALFELRGLDLFCIEPNCAPGAYQEAAPDFDMNTWTIERLELLEGAELTLTNRFDFQAPYDLGGDAEVLYVRELVLGPNSILDVALNRMYYETIDQDPTAMIINTALLGFSLDDIPFDDEDEFANRTGENNYEHPENPEYDRIHIERIEGLEQDPNGVMMMRNLEDLDPDSTTYDEIVHARAKGAFDKCGEGQVLVSFKYLFERSGSGLELVAYLSDLPELLDRDNPLRAEHYVEVGRVPIPPGGRPGSVGSGRFGVFEQKVSVGSLDLSYGTWVELELVQTNPQASSASFLYGGIRLASSDSSSEGSALIDGWAVEVHCDGICMDLNWSDAPDEEDFMLVLASCGESAGLLEGGVGSRVCLDGAFSTDGFVDLFDIASWDWALRDPARVSRLNMCGVPFSTGVGTTSAAVGSFEGSASSVSLMGLESLSDLLIAGKKNMSEDPAALKSEDRLYSFESNGQYVEYFDPKSDRCNIKLVKGPEGQLYQINSEEGVSRLDNNEVIVPPGEVELIDINEPRYDGPATVYIGIQDEGPDSFGRPILDAAFDADYVYVVPVVIEPNGQEAYAAAAKLQLLESGTPPYEVVQLYDDPPPAADNQKCNNLREIEIDSAGNIYVVNVHSLNESDILWKYGPDGTVLKRLDLGNPNSGSFIPDPIAMHVSDSTDILYITSGQYNEADVNSTVVYGFSTDEALTLKRSITINYMQHVTDITEDPATGFLWAVGFNMENIPDFPNPTKPPFYYPILAKIPYGSNDAQLTALLGSYDLGLPMSIVWTGTNNACYTGPYFDKWLAVGSPACWCANINPRQCHGDADGKSQGKRKYWVSTNDLDILIAAWSKPFAEIEGQDLNGTPLICADFDHLPKGKNEYHVSINDLDILVTNWSTAHKPDPNCP